MDIKASAVGPFFGVGNRITGYRGQIPQLGYKFPISAEPIAPWAIQRLRIETISPLRGQNPQPSVPPFSLPGVGSNSNGDNPACGRQAKFPAIAYLAESSLYGL